MRAAQLLGLAGAVVGPLAILVAAVVALAPPTELGEDALAFDQAVRRAPYDIIVTGASFARSDIDPVLLARELGSTQEKALQLPVLSSSAPVWYAILKKRVYGNGLRPKIIVLPIVITTAMVTQLPPAQMAKVTAQMPVPDEVIMRRTLGSSVPPAIHHLLEHRGDLRDPLLGAFRDALPRWILGAAHADVAAAGTAVFGEEHEEGTGGAFPTVAPAARVEARSAEEMIVRDPDESYLADIARLAAENGAVVAVVLPPTLRGHSNLAYLPQAVEESMVRWAAAHGVVWIDLRKLDWDGTRYRDGRHMTAAAARDFTKMVAEQLDAAGVMNGGPANLLVVEGVTRTGTPPPLPAVREVPGKTPCDVVIPLPGFGFLGRKALELTFPRLRSPIRVWEGDRRLEQPLKKGDCTGTASQRGPMVVNRFEKGGPPLRLAWSEDLPDREGEPEIYWVYPGTAVTWSFGGPWQQGDAVVRVVANVGVLGKGRGLGTLAVGKDEVPFEPSGPTAHAELPAATDEGPWTLTIRSPANGPLRFVQSLELEAGERINSLVAPPRPQGLELLAPKTWQVSDEPPPVEGLKLVVEEGKSWFEMPWPNRTGCSPLRVEHGGVLLPVLHPKGGGDGPWSWRMQDKLLFAPTPGDDPAVGYRVVYDTEHRCRKSCKECPEQVWLYPGGTLRVAVGVRARARFGVPLKRLRLITGFDEPNPTTGSVRAVLRLGDEVLVDHTIEAAEFGSTVDIPLPTPILPSDARDLTAEFVSSPGLPPVLLLGSLLDQ
jgi:hypothetical protein